MLACIVGNYNDSFLLANRLAVEAVLAIFNILEDGLLVFGIPADNVYEAGLVAQLATDALFGIELDAMISVYQNIYPPVKIYVLLIMCLTATYTTGFSLWLRGMANSYSSTSA